jgi:hypothetical protein
MRGYRRFAHAKGARERHDGIPRREPDLQVRGDTLLPWPEEEIIVLGNAPVEDGFFEAKVLRVHGGCISEIEQSTSVPPDSKKFVKSGHKKPSVGDASINEAQTDLEIRGGLDAIVPLAEVPDPNLESGGREVDLVRVVIPVELS